MSQTHTEPPKDAETSQLHKVGIAPGRQDLKANTLPFNSISRLLRQGKIMFRDFPTFLKSGPGAC